MFNLKFFLALALVVVAQVSNSICKPAAPDGPLYNPNSKETGPMSQELFDAHPRLSFLGSINGKNFYIERIVRSQPIAPDECEAMGMRLARIDTQAELTFIYARVSGSDDYSWTDGNYYYHNDGFVWRASNTKLSPGLILESGHSVGLTIGLWSRPQRYHRDTTWKRDTTIATCNSIGVTH